MPMGTPAMICGQGDARREAQAHQKRPGGSKKPPRIMGGRRVSGVEVEEAMAVAKVVREW